MSVAPFNPNLAEVSARLLTIVWGIVFQPDELRHVQLKFINDLTCQPFNDGGVNQPISDTRPEVRTVWISGRG